MHCQQPHVAKNYHFHNSINTDVELNKQVGVSSHLFYFLYFFFALPTQNKRK